MTAFSDQFWSSRDGLKLHYRDYPGGAEGNPAIICLSGLTRNARDFEDLAVQLAGEWRVLCPDLRGRGDSDYAKDSASYNPLQYAEDIEGLVVEAKLGPVVLIGTSLISIFSLNSRSARPPITGAAAWAAGAAVGIGDGPAGGNTTDGLGGDWIG